MMVSDYTQQLTGLLKQANSLILIIPEGAQEDEFFTMLSWRNQLKRRDKQVSLFAINFDKSKYSQLPYINEIETSLPLQRTIVKVALNESGVKKISYEVKDNQIFLYLSPKAGIIKGDQVAVNLEQLKGDIIMTVGIQKPDELKEWPAQWVSELDSHQSVVNLDNDIDNTQYGTLNLIDPNKKAKSQLTASIFKQLGWEIDADTATLLVNGIARATRHFTKNVDAEVFESVSELMKKGGKLEVKK